MDFNILGKKMLVIQNSLAAPAPYAQPFERKFMLEEISVCRNKIIICLFRGFFKFGNLFQFGFHCKKILFGNRKLQFSSLMILNFPSSEVFFMCGPAQTSFETPLTV